MCFLKSDFYDYKFALRTAFVASSRFLIIMFSLFFVSRNVLISLISSVNCSLFRHVLFNHHVFVFFKVVVFFFFRIIDI